MGVISSIQLTIYYPLLPVNIYQELVSFVAHVRRCCFRVKDALPKRTDVRWYLSDKRIQIKISGSFSKMRLKRYTEVLTLLMGTGLQKLALYGVRAEMVVYHTVG